MELISVRCNHCGAPLQIPGDARFVTCQYCKSELTVQRTEGAITTQELQNISQKANRMADDLGVLRIQGELELLNREWQMKREMLLVRNRRGELVEPGGLSLLSGCIIVFFGLPFLAALASGAFFCRNNSGSAIGFVLLAVVAVQIVRTFGKRNSYRAALAEYEQRNAELKRQLSAQSQGK